MRPKKLDSFGVHIFMGRGLFLLQEKINTIFKNTALWKKYLSFDTLSKIARKTRFCRTHANKNKTTPELIQGFVLFFYTKLFMGKCKIFVNRHDRYTTSCINEYVMIQFTLE